MYLYKYIYICVCVIFRYGTYVDGYLSNGEWRERSKERATGIHIPSYSLFL